MRFLLSFCGSIKGQSNTNIKILGYLFRYKNELQMCTIAAQWVLLAIYNRLNKAKLQDMSRSLIQMGAIIKTGKSGTLAS